MDQPTAIRNQFDTLTEAHPELRTRLEAGLLLALAGRVEGTGEYWVSGGSQDNGYNHVYHVTTDQSGWSCNCKDQEHGAPQIDDFGGHSGHICKHIAAVVLVSGLSEPVEPPATLYDFLVRLVQAQWMPAPPLGTKTVKGQPGHPILRKNRIVAKRRDLDLPGTPAKLIWDQVGDRPVACLRVNRKTSKPLVHWVSLPVQTNRGVWQLVTDAESRYREWVAELTG